MYPDIVVIAHDMRSTFNVGSLFRTAEGLGVLKIYLTGYTPYPAQTQDERLPHISQKLTAQIDKTALGATSTLEWEYQDDVRQVIAQLQGQGYTVAALEQTDESVDISGFKAPQKIALLLGTEVTGVPDELLALTDIRLVIPMFGQKESFNVVQAAAMALFQFRFHH